MLGEPDRHFNENEKLLDNLCDAWAKSALAWRTNIRYGHKAGELRCMSFVAIHGQLEVWRCRFQGGDTFALLQAVALCASENLPLPTWLANAYTNALQSFQTKGGPTSLDDVFRSSVTPTATPQKIETARRDWEIGQWLWFCAWNLAVSDQSITGVDKLVELLLQSPPPDGAPWRQWPVKKTKARELVLMVDKNQGELLNWPASKSLSQFLAKRRKRVI